MSETSAYQMSAGAISKDQPSTMAVKQSVKTAEKALVCCAFEGTQAEWDRLAAGFSDMSPEQTAAYSTCLWGERAKRFVILPKTAEGGLSSEVIGGAVVTMLAPSPLRRGLALVKFGPFWRRKHTDCLSERYALIIDAMVTEICERRGHHLTIFPRPEPEFCLLEERVLKEAGFVKRRHMTDPNRYLVDLSLPTEEQRQSLEQKWRYNLRKSLKNGVHITRDDSAQGVASFAALYRAMVHRKAFSSVDAIDAIPAMQSQLPEALQPRIYLASHASVAVAGAVVCVTGDVAYYVFGASAGNGPRLRAGYALHWHIVEDLMQSGARWYDLGGEAGETGLRQFKKGLTGRRGKIVELPGEYDRWMNRQARLVADGIFAIRAIKRRWRRRG